MGFWTFGVKASEVNAVFNLMRSFRIACSVVFDCLFSSWPFWSTTSEVLLRLIGLHGAVCLDSLASSIFGLVSAWASMFVLRAVA